VNLPESAGAAREFAHRSKKLTIVQRFTPYFTIRSFVIGAETWVI
jgi:hypothetical protein